MRLLIIRHGESEADLMDVHEGRADFLLTSRGNLQAKAMSNYIASHYNISKIYCSPLKRAKQTAKYLSEAANVDIIFDEKLMEFNNGLIAGLERTVAAQKYPYIVNIPIHSSVYEQESLLEFRYRAEFILSKIISENKDEDTIAIISHGGMINQLYCAFLKLPINCNVHFHTGDTGIHEWLITTKSNQIVFSNYCNHTTNI